MVHRVENLVFSGGGVLGTAYLGVLQYLYEQGLMANVRRTAGTSAGAIAACMVGLNLPFEGLKAAVDTLDYRKVPMKEIPAEQAVLPAYVQKGLDRVFDDWECVLRLVKNYGWFSSGYFYRWIQEQIARQFDRRKKAPPYSFADFNDPRLHVDGRPFYDVSIIGADISRRNTRVFSFETTPYMEVATAVRISMSIPVFFEAVKLEEDGLKDIYADGGVQRVYPLNLYDGTAAANPFTLGVRFKASEAYHEIHNLLDFIANLLMSLYRVQEDAYENDPQDIARSIVIDPGQVSFVDFDIAPGDPTYNFLYRAGYDAADSYFRKVSIMPYDGFEGLSNV